MKKSRQNRPISALDVAAYILANYTNNNPISAWKMHKLVYYCQAWSLVRDGLPIYHEKIIASPKGLVINELFSQHSNHLYVGDSAVGNLNHLSLRQVDTIDYVIKIYGKKTLEELDELISQEAPFIKARENVKSNPKESVEISLASIKDYYAGF